MQTSTSPDVAVQRVVALGLCPEHIVDQAHMHSICVWHGLDGLVSLCVGREHVAQHLGCRL